MLRSAEIAAGTNGTKSRSRFVGAQKISTERVGFARFC
jgi:hypothetical protein